MIIEFRLPQLNPNMTEAVVEILHQQIGTEFKAGEKLLDISVMLGASFAQECPPISYFRLVARERAWLRTLLVAEGDRCEVGAPIALLSSDPDELLDGMPERALRCVSAGIMFSPAMFSGRAA